MALSLKKVRQMTPEQRTAGLYEICGICGEPIKDEHPEEVQTVEGKPVHEDCYFKRMGGIVRNSPIRTAGIRRGR